MGAKQSSSNHTQIHIPWRGNNIHKLPFHPPQYSSTDTEDSGPWSPVSNQTNVSMTITKNVSQTEARDSNLVFSPLLIQMMLGLVGAGSHGPTRDQILSFLKSRSVNELNQTASDLSTVFVDGSMYGGPKLCFANGVWCETRLPLKPGFKHVAENAHKAACKQADFQTKAGEVTREVNSWVANKTNGLIKEILPPGSVNNSTRLILANALYFKGAWEQKFDPTRTSDSDFYLLNGRSLKVPFMTSTKKQFICAFNGFKVLRLCYEQGRDKRQFSMYIFLPDARNGLPSLMEMASSQPSFLDQHIPYNQVKVGRFMIPRFKISFGFEASKALKQLGLLHPFTEGGLTEMVDSPAGKNLCVSSIFHKAFIEVNEEGTEAAASTAAVIMLKSADFTYNVDFVADHPFLFFIREDTKGTVLFIGHLMNPLQQH